MTRDTLRNPPWWFVQIVSLVLMFGASYFAGVVRDRVEAATNMAEHAAMREKIGGLDKQINDPNGIRDRVTTLWDTRPVRRD